MCVCVVWCVWCVCGVLVTNIVFSSAQSKHLKPTNKKLHNIHAHVCMNTHHTPYTLHMHTCTHAHTHHTCTHITPHAHTHTHHMHAHTHIPRMHSPLQNIADVNEVGVSKTQTLVSNFFETFLLFTVYSKSI